MTHVPRNPAGDSGPEPPEPGSGARRLDPEDPLLLERLGVVIPDDARALDRDRRELVHRRARRPHPQLTGLLVTFSMLGATIALTAALLGVMTPTSTVPSPTAYELAQRPGTTPGSIGGLVPDAGATVNDAVGVSVRNLRPAVLFVPPPLTDDPCATCATALAALQRQAAEYGIQVYLLTAPDDAEAGRALLGRARAGSGNLLVDPAGTLLSAFGGTSTHAVLVHADGVIGGILSDPSPRGRYEQFISPLRLPAAPPSLQPATTSD